MPCPKEAAPSPPGLLHDRYVRQGMQPEEARRAARRQFGSAPAVREEIRQVNSLGWLDGTWSDVSNALRRLRDARGFATLAVMTLALGIGANSAMFALVDATLLRPLPFPNADRLVMVWERTPTAARSSVAPLNFHDWRARNRTFDEMAAVFDYARRLGRPDGTVEPIAAQQATPGFFELLGAQPIVGRTFRASDVTVPPSIAVIGEALWRSHFDSDPDVVGRVVEIDAQPFTVVGVIGDDVREFTSARLWTVWAELPDMDSRANRFMRVIGRLQTGTTVEAAQLDLERVASELAQEYPATNAQASVTIGSFREALVGTDIRSTAVLFLGVVGFVLLMCCVNVANLLLARTAGRTRELAVRAALGAGQGRIVRQLLIESVALATIGGVAGLALGGLILRLAPAMIPAGILPSTVVLSFDARVVAFCALTALGVGVLFGLAPAWQATRMSLVAALASNGRASTGGGGRLRRVLVVGEVAAAVLLLSGAGLLLRTLVAYRGVDAGVRFENVLTMQPSIDYGLPTSMFGSEAALRQFLDDLEREVRGIPGVASAGWAQALPLGGFAPLPVEIEGEQAVSVNAFAHRQIVSPGFFDTLGIPIVRGRNFTEQDGATSTPVAIVSEAFARQHLDGRNPIGTRVTVPQLTVGPGQRVQREIVGVAADVPRTFGEPEESRSIYVPVAQNPWSYLALLVRPTGGPAGALVPAVRAGLARVDRRVPIGQVLTLDDYMGLITARPRFRAVMVSTFAALALALAMVGVFGVLAYSVQQRRREFGVRIALGAPTTAVLRLVFAHAGHLIAAGALVGLVLAAFLAQSMSSFLFGVQPLDVLTFAGVAALVSVTAALASLVPALRASRVDPLVTFRSE